MQTWKLTLTYDGSAYHGWQIQPGGLRTIQGELQAALGRIAGENPLPQGSGRTDAGVHALGQVASFVLEAPIPPENLERALNRTLPSAIRVLKTEVVASAFHARHSAVAKTYEYRIVLGSCCSPFLTPYVHTCAWKLDMAWLAQAAGDVIGEHDFASMAATEPDISTRSHVHSDDDLDQIPARSTTRTIFSSEWESSPGDGLLVYRVRGSGFLHHMVRNLVGTMIEIGRGRFAPGAMGEILAVRSRSAAGPTAPAKGLFLHSVEYPPVS